MKAWLVTVVALSTMICSSALADIVRLDQSVAVKDQSGQKVIAFKSSTSCGTWSYIPGRYWTSKDFLQTTDYSGTKIDNKRYLTYVTALQFSTQVGYSDKDLVQLKSDIFNWLKNSKDCSGAVKSPSEVVLLPALVQKLNAAGGSDVGGDDRQTFFSRLGPTYVGHADAYSDPNARDSVTYVADASNPKVETALRNFQAASQRAPVKLGNIGMAVEGIHGHVNSHLRVIGSIDAKFASELKNIGCTEDNNHQNLGIGPAPMTYDSSRLTCTYKLLAEYKGGAFKNILVIDHSDSVLDIAGSPIMYRMCSENANEECRKVSLADFVEFRLFYEFLASNYDVIVKRLADATLSKDPGKNGDIKSDINVDIGYLRNFQGKMSIDIPVYSYQLDGSHFSFEALNDSHTKCIGDHYFDQMDKFSDYVQTNPMPIDKGCLHGNATN